MAGINKDTIYQHLKKVTDPELGIDIVSIGLIYDVKVKRLTHQSTASKHHSTHSHHQSTDMNQQSHRRSTELNQRLTHQSNDSNQQLTNQPIKLNQQPMNSNLNSPQSSQPARSSTTSKSSGLSHSPAPAQHYQVYVLMTLTSPGCPLLDVIESSIKSELDQIEGLDGYKDVEIELTFDPPWTIDMMDEAAKAELGF